MPRRADQRGADQVWPYDQGMALPAVAAGGTGESGRALRTLALIAVVVGLVALTTAACVLSYSSVHDFALKAGISPSLARIYPDICDAMLVMAGCSVLALRGAGVLAKVYGWLCFIVLLGALAASSVVHEAGINMPKRATEITAAVFPWALVLVAFGLLLALLRHARRRRQSQRAATRGGLGSARAELEPPALEAAVLGPSALEPAAEPAALEYETEAYAQAAATYGNAETFEYVTFQAPGSQYPSEADGPADQPGDHPAPTAQAQEAQQPMPEAAPAPPAPPATPSPNAVLRPTEMQLRARDPRQPQPVDADPAATETSEPSADAGASGYAGDTIPRSELNAAPTAGQRPELDRPRSSPTPPSD